ncbi:MAG: amidohydrolase family protein, partial [Myxococcota bacterium]
MLLMLACREGEGVANERPPVATVVLKGATIVDADGERVGDVVIDGDTIVAIGGAWAGNPDVVDVAGAWVTPGLADPHVHLAHAGTLGWVGDPLEANLRASLYHGVLAVMDLGGPEALFDLRDAVEAGDTLGPTIRATGPFLTAVGSHPCETLPDDDLCTFVDAETAGEAARARLDAGADAVKVALADAAF